MEVLASRRIYEGNVVNLRVDRVNTTRGEHEYEVVEHRGAVVVIARPSADSMVLVHQYRQPLGAFTWEACAGGIDGSEAPIDAARRELREETGLRAGVLRPLWSLYSAPGFCDELLHFFDAGALESGETDFDAGEDIETRTFSLDELRGMMERNELVDCKTQIAVLWALTVRA